MSTSTFNPGGGVQSVGATYPITSSGGNAPTISLASAAISYKSGNYSAQPSDFATLVIFSGGTYTFTLGNQAAGWWCDVIQTTLGQSLQLSVPNTINGAGTISVVSGQLVRIISLGGGNYVATPSSGAGQNALLIGSLTGYYGGLAPGVAGNLATSDGTTWKATQPVTSNNLYYYYPTSTTLSSTYLRLGANFAITPGTWFIWAALRVYYASASGSFNGRIINITDSVALATMQNANGSSAGTQQTCFLFCFFAPTANKTVDIDCATVTGTAAQITSDSNGYSNMGAIKLA